jgi:hypothetical protein
VIRISEHDVAKMAYLTLKRYHQMVSGPGCFELQIVIVVLHNISIIVNLIPNREIPDT